MVIATATGSNVYPKVKRLSDYAIRNPFSITLSVWSKITEPSV